MWTRFILLCFFVKFLRPIDAICTVSKYNDGFGDWVKCSDASLSDALNKGGPVVAAITISQSRILSIPENIFIKHANKLQSLNLQNCGILALHPNAFAGLTVLKKLNLPYNNITKVEPNWFISLVALEQLDLSFNKIVSIDPLVFARLTNIRRLNLDDNLLTCLETKDMAPMRSIAKIRIIENPLNMTCRGRMTLWFNDKGINYSSGHPGESKSWLDRILWLCAEEDYGKTKTEKEMRECVLLNIFNQLSLALKTTNSYRISAQQCVSQRQVFMRCIANSGTGPGAITNGEAITNLALAVRGARENSNNNCN